MPAHKFTVDSFTGHLRLVPPDPAFDETMSYIRTHPETRKYVRDSPDKMNLEEARALREKRTEDPARVEFYAFSLKEDGSRDELVGMSGIHSIDENLDSCEIGIGVAPGKHRNGYATEILYCVMLWLFEERKFHRATFETAVDNIPMQKWLERAEIRLEVESKGARRGGLVGEYHDTRGYALLDREWRDRVKANLEARIRTRWNM